MLICHINLARTYRGGERQTELLLRELAERGWAQRLVLRKGSEFAVQIGCIDMLDVRQTASNPVAAGRAAKGASLVHAHEARSVYAGWLATRLYGIPSVLTRRVTRSQKRRRLRDRAYRDASAIVAVSGAVAQKLRESCPDIMPRIIPDAHAAFEVDTEAVNAIRRRHIGKTLIGHIGSYDHSAKGQLTIIEVARRAADSHPHWQFLLLGAGRDEALFRATIGSLSNIELVGFVDNVGDYLSAFDVFVFPSLREALGSSVLDAMHFGLPIVATRVGGIPEFVEDGVNGLLIEPESPGELMAGIEKILDDRSLVDAMNLANREKASRYDAAVMADAYEDLYRKILTRPTSGRDDR